MRVLDVLTTSVISCPFPRVTLFLLTSCFASYNWESSVFSGVTCKLFSCLPVHVPILSRYYCGMLWPPSCDPSWLAATWVFVSPSSPSTFQWGSAFVWKTSCLNSIKEQLQCFFSAQVPPSLLQICICKVYFWLGSVLTDNCFHIISYLLQYVYESELRYGGKKPP